MTRETTDDDGTDSPTAADAGTDTDADTADGTGELPAAVVDEAERLTRLARRAVDPNEAAAHRERRDDLLAEHEFAALLRERDGGAFLVCHPTEWLVDGDVHPDRIADVGRAAERRLDGPGETEDWDALDEHNRSIADRVAAEHGERHGANARAFAEFMSNHYARPIEQATDEICEEFRTDYYRRNAWPSDAEREVVAESVALVREIADEERREEAGG